MAEADTTKVWGPLPPGYSVMVKDGHEVAIHPNSVDIMAELGFEVVSFEEPDSGTDSGNRNGVVNLGSLRKRG